jgi:hypothetical protein
LLQHVCTQLRMLTARSFIRLTASYLFECEERCPV